MTNKFEDLTELEQDAIRKQMAKQRYIEETADIEYDAYVNKMHKVDWWGSKLGYEDE